MIKDNKKRLTVTFTDSVIADLDKICEQMGVTKSQFIAVAVGEKIYQYKTASDVLSKLGSSIINSQK